MIVDREVVVDEGNWSVGFGLGVGVVDDVMVGWGGVVIVAAMVAPLGEESIESVIFCLCVGCAAGLV